MQDIRLSITFDEIDGSEIVSYENITFDKDMFEDILEKINNVKKIVAVKIVRE